MTGLNNISRSRGQGRRREDLIEGAIRQAHHGQVPTRFEALARTQTAKLAIIILVVTGCIHASNASPRQGTAPPANRPMIVHNPNGTLTVQKEPAKGQADGAKSRKGLVIPPQIVVPFTLGPRSAKHSSVGASPKASHRTKSPAKSGVEPTKPAVHHGN